VNNNKTLILVILLTLFNLTLWPSSALANTNRADVEIPIYFFWGDGCPHCAAEKPFLESLVQKYPQLKIQKYEVWNVEANQQILEKVASIMGFEATGVPVTIIGEKFWIGYSEGISAEMEAAVKDCIQNSCKSPIDPKILSAASSPSAQTNSSPILTLPLIGVIREIDLGKRLFLVIGIALALIVLLYFIYIKVFQKKNQIRNQRISKNKKNKKIH